MRDILKKVVIFVLTLEAKLVLWRYEPKIIAITGSMGKTSAKDAAYAVLRKKLNVRKSEKSFNSELGIPLTILGLENAWSDPLMWLVNIFRGLLLVVQRRRYPEWLILEVGADRPGDIRKAAVWLRPHVAVITGVPEIPVHVEFFPSIDDLIREKCSLAEHMREGGTLILNGDDSRVSELCDPKGTSIRYGFSSTNHFYATHQGILYEGKRPSGVRFRLVHKGSSTPTNGFAAIAIQGALGRARIYAALVGCAIGEAVGVGKENVAEALSTWEPPPGRMRVIPGVNGSTIIDDTYNSSPAAALAALDTLKEIKVGEGNVRVAALGDMLELGRYAAEAHRSVGERAPLCATKLITVGLRSRTTAGAALDAGMPESSVLQYEHNESARAGKELRSQLKNGDVVLVKGSQSVRMERLVKEIMAEPEKAPELLVRQESEWQNR